MFWFHLASVFLSLCLHLYLTQLSRDIISSCRHFKHSTEQNAINTAPTQTKNLTSYSLFGSIDFHCVTLALNSMKADRAPIEQCCGKKATATSLATASYYLCTMLSVRATIIRSEKKKEMKNHGPRREEEEDDDDEEKSHQNHMRWSAAVS